MTTPEFKTLRDLILKSEGRNLGDELGEGCEIQFKDRGEVVKCKFGELYRRKQDGELIWINEVYCEKGYTAKDGQICYKFYSEESKSFSGYGYMKVEILGRPISIERLLMALGEGYLISHDGRVYEEAWHSDNYQGSAEQSLMYQCELNLALPLHEQEPATINKLIEILTPGK